ncbi:hypothetical protein SPURM210S_06666 [Streptomyces purpurascens]
MTREDAGTRTSRHTPRPAPVFLRGVEETAYRELTAPDAWLP